MLNSSHDSASPMTTPSADTTRWVAHRGVPSRCPENSLAGIDCAIDAGASWIEVDVQITADGVPVLHHDADLCRVTGSPGKVGELSLATLRGLDFGEVGRLGSRFTGTRVATLREAAGRVADAGASLYVELKRTCLERFSPGQAAEAVARALAGAADRCVIISSSADLLQASRTLGVTRQSGWIMPRWDRESRSEAEALRPDFLFCNVRKLPGDDAPLPSLGARWVLYVVDDPGEAAAWLGRGAWQVETDRFPDVVGP
jgi:glycerophosphoryl diester phosphodiesterase